LDHAGTTLIAKSSMERFAADMIGNLYGNPHSASPASQVTARRIDDVRLRLLQMFQADPEYFDLVFVANATAGVKLVMDAFAGLNEGFCYRYHRDSHTSLVGMREATSYHHMFSSDAEMQGWIHSGCPPLNNTSPEIAQLVSYPAQSNMNGRRLPLDWLGEIARQSKEHGKKVYSLLDAAAYVSTCPLDFSNPIHTADFTVLSLYKIFGFPDLGALIVRKEAGHIFENRRYFGGGTVDMVISWKEQWHARKGDYIHEQLEDGTLPVHSILALDHAVDVHSELFGTLNRVSRHTTYLANRLYWNLLDLKHGNGNTVCEVYKDGQSTYSDASSQGPIIAFNIRNQHGAWISNSEIEKLAAVKNIQLRTGTLCNPAGVAMALHLEPWEMRSNFSAGQRCGNENGNDIRNGKPTGMIRVSLGAISSLSDIEAFVGFIKEFFVQPIPIHSQYPLTPPSSPRSTSPVRVGRFSVDSIIVYPIKSCRGFRIKGSWPIRRGGLAWDREWCLVHEGTTRALSMKQYPAMSMLAPEIDFDDGVLRVRDDRQTAECDQQVTVPLSNDPRQFEDPQSRFFQPTTKLRLAKVCGENVELHLYQSSRISDFFSGVLGTRCQLARYSESTTYSCPSFLSQHALAAIQGGDTIDYSSACSPRRRFTKDSHVEREDGSSVTRFRNTYSAEDGAPRMFSIAIPGAFPDTGLEWTNEVEDRSRTVGSNVPKERYSLANESPILIVSKSSVEQLNEDIRTGGGSHVASADVFRPNIVIAESTNAKHPYIEDSWKGLRVGNLYLALSGPCRRCTMVCINQKTGQTSHEPYATLAKKRRVGGRVIFGQHGFHLPRSNDQTPEAQNPMIGVNDLVEPLYELPKAIFP
jgi:molybdenum cofactor sulfurtransferase